ncbi:MAG: alpha/beta fold hydrolase [Inquilinus sp.]|nr:alpha/beta fold hydrolase [Inquilinus sp.]
MTPLVLLPGMMCDARLFAPQIAALSAARTIVVAAITGADSIAALAAGVLAEAPPRFALAGLSMGGIVAMEILRQAPERVERVALLDTNHLAEAPERQALRGPQVDRVFRGELRKVLIEEMKPLYLAPENRSDERILGCALDMAVDLGPAVFARQSEALRTRTDQSATLCASRIPALVLCGAHDTLCPVERHRQMAALLPRARIEIIAGAGHLSTLERPEETTEALRRWLAMDPQ